MRTRSNYITAAIYSSLFDRATSRLGQSYSIVSVHKLSRPIVKPLIIVLGSMLLHGVNGGSLIDA